MYKKSQKKIFGSAKSNCRSCRFALCSYCHGQVVTFPTVLKLKSLSLFLPWILVVMLLDQGLLAETGKAKVSISIALEQFHFFGGDLVIAGADLHSLVWASPSDGPVVSMEHWDLCSLWCSPASGQRASPPSKGGLGMPRSWVHTAQANRGFLFFITRKILYKNSD